MHLVNGPAMRRRLSIIAAALAMLAASQSTASAAPSITSIPAVVFAGDVFVIDGNGFTNGSVVNFFVATASGAINVGPLIPSNRTATQLTVPIPGTISLGEGVAAVQVVNTDQGFAGSNTLLALLEGSAAAGIPSITGINGVGLAATSVDLGFAVANVETAVVPGSVVTIDGAGFETINGVAIDLFCACAGGKVGPFFIPPGTDLTETTVSFTLPASGANSPAAGPGSFRVSNRGADNLFTKASNGVAVAIGAAIAITSATHDGPTITVTGAGFSSLTVVNFFNAQGSQVFNLGGLNPDGSPAIDLTLVSDTQFSFALPDEAGLGAAFVEAINPPFTPFSRAGAVVQFVFCDCSVKRLSQVLTHHNDPARTGRNLTEIVLNPSNVNSAQFGKVVSYPVDGQVYAQPLYMEFVNLPGRGPSNMVFVATEHDSAYAFDADSNVGANASPLWQKSFLGPGVTTVPAADTPGGCTQITPEIGITGTPVIDPVAGTLYVVAMTKEVNGGNATYVHRIHALDITNGNERPGGPVVVQASVPGSGDGGSTVTLIPRNYKERPGLLLLNGVVYTAWSSHCDAGIYHGWLIGYDAQTLTRVSVFNTTPDGGLASIWAAGGGPAADVAGNIYLTSGNGTFDANTGGRNLGDSFIKLSAVGGGLSAIDYFAPFNQAVLEQTDADLGSSGILLLPTKVGSAAHPHLMTSAGKEGRIYLLDRDNLGHFHAGSDSQIVQSLVGAITPLFSTPAYFNGSVYFSGVNDRLKAFSISQGRLSASATSQTATSFGYPGSVPSISASGLISGIVWAIENGGNVVLHAYDAANLAHELYNSTQAGPRDNPGGYVKFTAPTIANGRVYVGTANSLAVFGLLPVIQPVPQSYR
jgi:hypothetical protein